MRQATSIGSLFGMGLPRLRLPGNGRIVGAIEPRKGDLIPVYGPAPVKSGKRYRDSGYPGSVRRRMAAMEEP
jgi:hypothetical protein